MQWWVSAFVIVVYLEMVGFFPLVVSGLGLLACALFFVLIVGGIANRYDGVNIFFFSFVCSSYRPTVGFST